MAWERWQLRLGTVALICEPRASLCHLLRKALDLSLGSPSPDGGPRSIALALCAFVCMRGGLQNEGSNSQADLGSFF